MIVVNGAELKRRLAEKNIRAYDLQKKYGLGHAAFKKAVNSEIVGMNAVGIFCDAIGCQPEDILMKVKDA